MPTTIEELEAAIQDTISQANSILFVNSNILQQYQDRQRKVLFIVKTIWDISMCRLYLQWPYRLKILQQNLMQTRWNLEGV